MVKSSLPIVWTVYKTYGEKRKEKEKAFAAMLNKPAPDFELTDIIGNRWHLNELRNKIVVLNFWFTSCAPCIREMPELNKLVQAYKHKNVVFLGLTFSNADQVKTFQKKYVFQYSLLPNSSEVNEKYHISSWPTSIILNKKGDIKFIIQSSPKIREKLETVIDSLL